ncbi:MAG: DUF423 domain-containing protein [Acidobacteria bacterium]|nr:DUF423 domain-containing protein [Acidobacteriota bacterium]MYH21702.1 DUF423 domain-containing protein [Acidobacteriota bacterium]MYK78244.1 DUF423 domain-containing protein [Acidobacteriota bacterium]
MSWVAVGAAALMVGVVAGAFGAHGLAPRLDARSLQTFETAVRYHLIHGLGLLAIGTLVARDLGSPAWLAGALMTAGIVLFSGSLYWLALGGPSWLGPVTPLGGLCLIAAWACLVIAVVRQL